MPSDRWATVSPEEFRRFVFLDTIGGKKLASWGLIARNNLQFLYPVGCDVMLNVVKHPSTAWDRDAAGGFQR